MQRDEPAASHLYLVGTPIGNLGDFSPRAKALLTAVDVIACEDTRHSGVLLSNLQARGRKISFHQHNTRTRLPQLLELLAEGNSLAVISDAGLPGISDPGEDLSAAARAAGYPVICIPGPCAATTALVCSGLPSARFCFEGFLPAKGRERQTRLEAMAAEQRTTVLYEAPHRLISLLEELQSLCGADRPLQVARELTKRHEQQVGPTIAAALTHFQERRPQGEFTLVLGGCPAPAPVELDDATLVDRMQAAIRAGASTSSAARLLASETGISRRKLYGLIHDTTAD